MLRYICNRPNDGLNSDKDKDSEEGTGPTYISAGQVIAQTDFRIDFGTHITNNLEAERDDVKNVNDMQNEAHSENKDSLEKEEDFNSVLETKGNDLSKWFSKDNPPKCVEKWI